MFYIYTMDIASAADLFGDIISPLHTPSKRIFVGYLIASMTMIGIYAMLVRKKAVDLFRNLFSKDIWFSKSARLDYMIFLINRLFMLLMAHLLLTKLIVATYLFDKFHVIFEGRPAPIEFLPDWGLSLLFTFTLFLFDDASKFWLHRLMHRNVFLWQFHKIHHDAEKMTPFTVYRIHPVEALLFSLRAVLIQGLIIALFIFFFGSKVSLVDVFGANIFIFLFNITGSNLRHSHVWISYGDFLEKFFISPAQHQIHHSNDKAHYDRNFGVVLAIWDNLGRSLFLSSKVTENIQFGTHNKEDSHRLVYAYINPIKLSLKYTIHLYKTLKDTSLLTKFSR